MTHSPLAPFLNAMERGFLICIVFSSQRLACSLAGCSILQEHERVGFCKKTVEPQLAGMPHQTIGSFTHFVGSTTQSVQTKEGQDKLRESAGSLYQRKDERCLQGTHHHIWCRQRRYEMLEEGVAFVSVCRRPPPPNSPTTTPTPITDSDHRPNIVL